MDDDKLEYRSVADRLISMIRDGIDAANFFARHEAISGMTAEDSELVELAGAVEAAADALEEAVAELLDYEPTPPSFYDPNKN